MTRSFLGAALLGAALVLAACEGDFDQRVDVARTIGDGGDSTGTTVNPSNGEFVRGNVSIGGSGRFALVTLRPVKPDGSIDFDDSNALGVTSTFNNGIYQAIVRNRNYRGPIVVEVRGQNVAGVQSDGGNPATASSQQLHVMNGGHVLYGVMPLFEGFSAGDVNVTPLTTCAVTRAQFLGGMSAGMYGLTNVNLGQHFGMSAIRTQLPFEFANSGSFGNNLTYSYVMAALSQVARNIGVANVWDFYLGMSRDCLDDGILNGSIGFVPNTGVAMPDLSAASILSNALQNDYLAPGNIDRVRAPDNTGIVPGSELANLIAALTPARNINGSTYTYELILRVPGTISVAAGNEYGTRIFSVDQFGSSTYLEPYGDSGGPCFVNYQFVSSSPANVSITPFGRITVPLGATPGNYSVSLTVSPAPAQTLITGPTRTFGFTVNVK